MNIILDINSLRRLQIWTSPSPRPSTLFSFGRRVVASTGWHRWSLRVHRLNLAWDSARARRPGVVTLSTTVTHHRHPPRRPRAMTAPEPPRERDEPLTVEWWNTRWFRQWENLAHGPGTPDEREPFNRQQKTRVNYE